MIPILLISTLLFSTLFVMGLLLEGYVYQAGGTMDERKAIVFEIYRYAICFVMIIMFAVMAFQLFSGLLADMSNPAALAPPGIGAILAALIFFAHWFMKSPGETKPNQDASGNA